MPHAAPTRREVLQVGYSGLLGLTLSQVAAASPAAKKPKSVLLVFLTGAASHIDTFDPKPDAPVEVRGEFKAIRTATPGVMLGEHLPRLAALSDKYSLVRSFAHKDNNHTAATHHLITGSMQPGVRFDKPLSRDDWPCYSAGVSYARTLPPGVPAGVTLPSFLREGPLVWPGQHAGFLGPKHDPWQIDSDPAKTTFRVDNVRLADGLDVQTLDRRRDLLASMNRKRDALAESLEGKRLSEQQEKAFAVLASDRVARAFDLGREPEKTRERYGRHMFGQSLLLSRRLIEAGVPVVQANMGRVQNWDSHSDNFRRLKNDLLPPLDRGVSALLEDMSASGLLESTLVVVMGEFGRTPKVDTKNNAGRDHWAACFAGLFAGAGVRGGNVVGKSDATAAYPVTPAFSPDDLGATVYTALGVEPHQEVRDRLNRPVQLNRGRVIAGLYE